MRTLWRQWEKNAREKAHSDAIIHWIPGKEPFRWTFSGLLEAAEKYAIFLSRHGVKRNEVCALIIRHHPEFYPLYMGVSALGAIPAVLAYPNPRLHPDKFRQGIEGMSRRSGLDWLITESSLLEVLEPVIKRPESTIHGILCPLERETETPVPDRSMIPADIRETDPCLLQHSSGTTGLQKPVLLTHQAVFDHAEAYGEAIRPNGQDKVVSWLPLYHDMGLIAAFHLPMLYGIPSVQISPFDWVLAPELLIEAISREKATLAWLPNFAYNLMTDRVKEEDIEGLSLQSIRMLINSGEPIRKNSHQRFAEKFKKWGLDPSTLSTSYGMAETTFAVTQTRAGELPAEIRVNRRSLAAGKVLLDPHDPEARVCVSAGPLIRGCEVMIVDEERKPLPSGTIGELYVKSLSLFDGYRNYPEKTAEVMWKGWYCSGDLGFEMEGNYYIIGRKKDLIINAGKNIYPEDVEDAVALVQGVIPGRVIAFGEEHEELGTELISVIAETHEEREHARKNLKLEILRAGMEIDVTLSNVYLVPPRWLIKSSAGKPGRNTNKERISVKDEKEKWRVL